MTTKDAAQRVRQQVRGTSVPEEPLILRVYRTTAMQPREVEQKFHLLLNAAVHTRPTGNTGSREWFETSTEFLDAIAAVLGLETLQADEPNMTLPR
jgi:hypothetical protein